MSKQHVMTHSASLSPSSWFPNRVCLRLIQLLLLLSLLPSTTCPSLTGWKCPQTMVYHSAIVAYRGSVLNVKLSNTEYNILLPEDNNNNDSFIPYPGPVQAIDVGKLAILAVNPHPPYRICTNYVCPSKLPTTVCLIAVRNSNRLTDLPSFFLCSSLVFLSLFVYKIGCSYYPWYCTVLSTVI